MGQRLCLHPHNLGLATARNTGWQAATAPLIAFADDDCRPQARWAEMLRDAYADPLVVAVGGQVSSPATTGFLSSYYGLNNPLAPLEADLGASPSLSHRLTLYVKRSLHGQTRTGRRPVFSLPGASMSMRRSALELVGGFDGGIRFGGEDEDFFYRLRAALPNAVFLFEAGSDDRARLCPLNWRRPQTGTLLRAWQHPQLCQAPGLGADRVPRSGLAALLMAAAVRRPGWLAAGVVCRW